MKIQLIRENKKTILFLCLLPFLAAAGLLTVKNLYMQYAAPHMPPCFFRVMTGYRCISCGLTHSVLAICRLQFAEAFRQNPIAPLGLLLALVYYLELWLKALHIQKTLIPRKNAFWLGVLSALVGYAVLRNLINI
ncbi:MAG: DUF2752 domain-containing protein [Oscillospiraceae bacterium]|nr:DUF2752 domain-containing protein [Oscillospiraceae bacterium]